jgi:hypothetical protein
VPQGPARRLGELVGGLTVTAVTVVTDRTATLRATWFLSAAIHLVLWMSRRRPLTTERIDAARAAATPTPSDASTP